MLVYVSGSEGGTYAGKWWLVKRPPAQGEEGKSPDSAPLPPPLERHWYVKPVCGFPVLAGVPTVMRKPCRVLVSYRNLWTHARTGWKAVTGCVLRLSLDKSYWV